MTTEANCATCQHPRSAHVASLFGMCCLGRTATDLPEWVDRGTACNCTEFTERGQ